jgi:hypothetical protein
VLFARIDSPFVLKESSSESRVVTWKSMPGDARLQEFSPDAGFDEPIKAGSTCDTACREVVQPEEREWGV